MGPTLSVQIEKRFHQGFQLVADLEVPLQPAGVTVLFGHSGAGKSTLLRCVAGLERPDAGHIRLGDERWFDAAAGVDLPPQRRRPGFLFQDYALFPHLSVRQNLRFGAPDAPAAAIDALLERFDLGALADRRPATLSGGQAQRVGLARALAAAPRVLLLDEPLSALDAPLRMRLHGELRRALAEAGVPAVLVTHDRAEALALGDALVVLERGAVLQQGEVQAVFDAPATAAVARAVGWENVLPVEDLGPDDEGRAVRWAGQRLRCAAPADQPAPAAPHLCLRPEDLHLGAAPPGANALQLVLRSVIREDTSLRLELEGGLVGRVHRRRAAELQPGAALTLWVAPRDLHLTRGGGR
ncbi:MAG: ABC transporter ATP-binding protein [Deltaproteobacteria bacterium]|nr:ABC transporter ATP-binding protein [Deltaproteobacteria bacterium]